MKMVEGTAILFIKKCLHKCRCMNRFNKKCNTLYLTQRPGRAFAAKQARNKKSEAVRLRISK
jgi:hypothetical protein